MASPAGGGVCRLIEGPFAYFVQLLLALIALCGLFLKRYVSLRRCAFVEEQRPLWIWCLDVTKQCLGQLCSHLGNVALAVVLATIDVGVSRASSSRGSAAAGPLQQVGAPIVKAVMRRVVVLPPLHSHAAAPPPHAAAAGAVMAVQGDQCAWYFINYTADTLLGIPTVWALLLLLQAVARHCRGCSALAQSGDYDPQRRFGATERWHCVKCGTWAVQTVSWICVVLIAKVLLGLTLFPFGKILGRAGLWLFAPLREGGHAMLELTIVMVIVPSLLSVIAFWIYDNILMMHPPVSGSGSRSGSSSGGASSSSSGAGGASGTSGAFGAGSRARDAKPND
jgi:uncharacterized membrane protein YgcG